MNGSVNQSQPQPIAPKGHEGSWLRTLLMIIFRLLLLGVGGGIAFLGGIAIAQFYPDPHPREPWIELLRRYPPQPAPPQPSPLTEPQKQALQAELTQIQGQLQAVSDRLSTLESQVSVPRPQEPIETRLKLLSQALNQDSAIAFSAFPLTRDHRHFKVILPSDALFPQGQSILAGDRQPILDNIITELQNYQKASLQIAVHTDNLGEAPRNLELSLEQARAIQHYLTQTLGDKYRYSVVGYGEAFPFVSNDTETNRQRNRRIELSLD